MTMCGKKTTKKMPEEPREWQKPLTEEKILALTEQFSAAKARIEAMWGVAWKPWANNRDV